MPAEMPEFKRNPHGYAEWMAAIPFGLTPDGKKITRIHFVDAVSEGREGRHANIAKDEFVWEVSPRDFYTLGSRWTVTMLPGSILVSYGTGSIGTLNERPGECVLWIY